MKKLVMFIAVVCLTVFGVSVGKDYETYAGDKFVIHHENELGGIVLDTVEIVSKTEKSKYCMIKLTDGTWRAVQSPDFIIPLK